MGALWTNVGVYRANNVLGSGGVFGSSGWRFGLFVNNYTPLVTTVIGDMVPPSNSGYSNYASMGWTSGASSGGVSIATVMTHTFTFTANAFAETVYGWYFETYDGTSYTFCALKRLATPYLIPPGGGSLALTVTLSTQKLP